MSFAETTEPADYFKRATLYCHKIFPCYTLCVSVFVPRASLMDWHLTAIATSTSRTNTASHILLDGRAVQRLSSYYRPAHKMTFRLASCPQTWIFHLNKSLLVAHEVAVYRLPGYRASVVNTVLLQRSRHAVNSQGRVDNSLPLTRLLT